MSRKRFIKLLMGYMHIPRNEAVVLADACNGQFSHATMLLCAIASPELRAAAHLLLPSIRQGATLTVAKKPKEGIFVNLTY